MSPSPVYQTTSIQTQSDRPADKRDVERCKYVSLFESHITMKAVHFLDPYNHVTNTNHPPDADDAHGLIETNSELNVVDLLVRMVKDRNKCTAFT